MRLSFAQNSAALLVVAALSLSAARADESAWRVRVGPGLVVAPEYPGADDEEVLPIPAIDIAYGRSLFLDSRRGIGAYLINDAARQIGASVWFRRGRDRDDGEPIAGLEDIDDSAVARLFFGQNYGPLALNATVAQAITDNTGLIVDASAAWRSMTREVSEAWTLSAFAAYDVLVGDAADSPIVEREAMPMIALAALYRFTP